MSQASSAARSDTTGTNRDTISGGAINPIVAAILGAMVLIVGLVALVIFGRKGGK